MHSVNEGSFIQGFFTDEAAFESQCQDSATNASTTYLLTIGCLCFVYGSFTYYLQITNLQVENGTVEPFDKRLI